MFWRHMGKSTAMAVWRLQAAAVQRFPAALLMSTRDVAARGVVLQGHTHTGDSGGTTGAAQYSELNLD